MWKVLRGRGLGGLKFRRQHPVDGFVVDFYCAERRLIVEVDGSVHDRQRAADEERQAVLDASGYRVVRLTNTSCWILPPRPSRHPRGCTTLAFHMWSGGVGRRGGGGPHPRPLSTIVERGSGAAETHR